MRARDALGRPVSEGDLSAVEPVGEQALPAEQALALAQRLLTAGRAFSAHEVLEASWKAAPADERASWQGLAQICVGVTHLQRGNLVGAARLLRRGAATAPADVAAQALALAGQVDDGRTDSPVLRLPAAVRP